MFTLLATYSWKITNLQISDCAHCDKTSSKSKHKRCFHCFKNDCWTLESGLHKFFEATFDELKLLYLNLNIQFIILEPCGVCWKQARYRTSVLLKAVEFRYCSNKSYWRHLQKEILTCTNLEFDYLYVLNFSQNFVIACTSSWTAAFSHHLYVYILSVFILWL